MADFWKAFLRKKKIMRGWCKGSCAENFDAEGSAEALLGWKFTQSFEVIIQTCQVFEVGTGVSLGGQCCFSIKRKFNKKAWGFVKQLLVAYGQLCNDTNVPKSSFPLSMKIIFSRSGNNLLDPCSRCWKNLLFSRLGE